MCQGQEAAVTAAEVLQHEARLGNVTEVEIEIEIMIGTEIETETGIRIGRAGARGMIRNLGVKVARAVEVAEGIGVVTGIGSKLGVGVVARM